MQNIYIVRLDGELLCFYYTNESGICYRSYENNRWSKPSVMVSDATENYTVNLSGDGTLYIFSQDKSGSINLTTGNEAITGNEVTTGRKGFSTRVILKNQSTEVHNIVFNAAVSENGLNLIYNMPVTEDKQQYLVSQFLNHQGEWSAANRIDKFSPMANNLFQIQNVSAEHLLVFYQTKTPESNIGYREILQDKMGNYNVFHSTAYQIMDYSFLTTDEGVHVLYIVKSMFSYQMIYRRKTDGDFSPPIVVWESSRLSNCLLFVINREMTAAFQNNGQLYVCSLQEGAQAFSRPVKYTNKFCLNPSKAVYLCGGQRDKRLVCREIFVDRLNPWDIQMFPDLYEDFYPVFVPAPAVVKAPEPVLRQQANEVNDEYNGFFSGMEQSFKGFDKRGQAPQGNANSNSITSNNGEAMENYYKLKNQYEQVLRQSQEKDRQILNLTSLLSGKNEEMVTNEQVWRIRYNKLAAQMDELKKEPERELKMETENLE